MNLLHSLAGSEKIKQNNACFCVYPLTIVFTQDKYASADRLDQRKFPISMITISNIWTEKFEKSFQLSELIVE